MQVFKMSQLMVFAAHHSIAGKLVKGVSERMKNLKQTISSP